MRDKEGKGGGGLGSGNVGKLLKEGGEMVVRQCVIQHETPECAWMTDCKTGSKAGYEQLAMTGTSLKQPSNFAGLGPRHI